MSETRTEAAKFYGVTAPRWMTDDGFCAVLRDEAIHADSDRYRALYLVAADRIEERGLADQLAAALRDVLDSAVMLDDVRVEAWERAGRDALANYDAARGSSVRTQETSETK